MPLDLNPKRLQRELKRLQYELTVAQKQTPYLRGMIEGTRDRLALLSRRGEILEYNSAFARQFAHDEGAVIYGRAISTVYTRAKVSSDPMSVRGLIDDQALKNVENSRYYGFFENEAIEIELNPLKLQDVEVIVLSARPLDELGKRERELNNMRLQLDELSERLSIEREQERAQRVEALALLAGTLAHDLNNALAVVCSNLDLLGMIILDRFSVDAEINEAISDILEGVASARVLSDKLKTFTKGESAELKMLEFNSWFQGVARALKKAHQDRLSLDISDVRLWLQADEAQLSQLMINLVTNGFQSMEEAGTSPCENVFVEVKVVQGREIVQLMFSPQNEVILDARYILISVSDRGTGIEEANLQKIFDPFFSTKEGGSGIGLASAVKIVFGHRGGIAAHNREGGGACFCVALPLSDQPLLLEDQETPVPITLEETSLADFTVIVMDDEPHVRQTMKRVLVRHQAHVIEASCCEEVIEARRQLLSDHPEHHDHLLFLLDLNLEGGRSGVDTLDELLILDPSSRVIACSGYFPHSGTMSYEQMGFKAFLPKPFTASELVSVISRIAKT